MDGKYRGLLDTVKIFRTVKPPILVSFIFVIALILLPFYDLNNIPLNLANVANINSHFPSLYNVKWIGGPFTMSIFIPAYYAYIFSGYALYAAYTLYKLIFLVLIFLMAKMISSLSEDEKKKNRIFLLVFLNPVLLFVSFIWVSIVVFPIFFLFLSMYLLRHYEGSSHEKVVQVLAGLSFVVSAFFYWYPVLLIPALFLYSNIRRKSMFFVTLISGLAIVSAVYLLTMYPSVSTFIATLKGSNNPLYRPEISGVQFFFHITTVEYILILLVASFLVPVIAKIRGLSEYTAFFIIIAVLLGFSNLSTPNDNTFILPFSFLPLILSSESRWKKTGWYLLPQLLPISTIILISLYIGNTLPDGVGIFMWGYYVFHLNVVNIITSRLLHTYFIVYNSTVILSILISVTFVICVDLRNRRLSFNNSVKELKSGAHHSRVNTVNNSFGTKRLISVVLIVILVLIPVSFLVNDTLPTTVKQHDNQTFPVYFFLPRFVPDTGNVIPPLQNITYSVNGNTVLIYSSSPEITFGRHLNARGVDLNITFTFKNLKSSAEFLNSSLFVLSYFHNTVVNSAEQNMSYSAIGTDTLMSGITVKLKSEPVSNKVTVSGSPESSFVQPVQGPVSLLIKSNGTATSLHLNGKTYAFHEPLNYLFFGKLSPGNYSEKMTMNSFSMNQYLKNNYYILPTFWIAVLPYILLLIAAILYIERVGKTGKY